MATSVRHPPPPPLPARSRHSCHSSPAAACCTVPCCAWLHLERVLDAAVWEGKSGAPTCSTGGASCVPLPRQSQLQCLPSRVQGTAPRLVGAFANWRGADVAFRSFLAGKSELCIWLAKRLWHEALDTILGPASAALACSRRATKTSSCGGFETLVAPCASACCPSAASPPAARQTGSTTGVRCWLARSGGAAARRLARRAFFPSRCHKPPGVAFPSGMISQHAT
jgi:hypothetical protein